jgi:hypothetical protein
MTLVNKINKNKCIVYKTTDTKTGKYYIGVDTNNNPKYLGSGREIKKIIADGRKTDLKKEILFSFDNSIDAFIKEGELVTEELIKNDQLIMNKAVGGNWGNYQTGYLNIKNPDGNGFLRIKTEDYDKNKHQIQSTGMVTVVDENSETGYTMITSDEYQKNKDKYIFVYQDLVSVFENDTGNKVTISVDEYRVNKNLYTHINSNKIVVFDNKLEKYIQIDKEEFNKDLHTHIFEGKCIAIIKSTGEQIYTTSNDPRWNTGELEGHRKGYHNYKDVNGNIVPALTDDSRVLSGELKSANSNKIVVKDKNGNFLSVFDNDPRYLNGELVGVNANKTSGKIKSTGETGLFDIDDPRWNTGELIGINAGNKYMFNRNYNCRKQVSEQDIEKYKDAGWEIGFGSKELKKPISKPPKQLP